MTTTTAGERFTELESQQLAALVYKRFGWDRAAATAAWNRMLQNNCSEGQFEELAKMETANVRRGLR